ncbi:LB_137 family protein [Leptospira yasudae]|uniref:Uncharacterized protein n=1 Tax=Leptospira yasudae TaxID=2202201 RepID=A0A6N4R0J5_9LEPT|nr:hypothetical protein [Leptospira yasudae]TGL83050.1 hypothetical protein EHQ77_01985 [Leptospira yasudae]TGL83639.1 hypothetical protein EHQ72_01925 [Leptospira yasudae]TGL85719.1 hypothetical protein EHQ83_07700 [Leptospira yasudae]
MFQKFRIDANYIFLIIFLFLSQNIFSDTIRLRKNKTPLVGKIIQYKENGVELLTAEGKQEVPSKEIEKIELGFNGIRTQLKTVTDSQTSEVVLLEVIAREKFVFYDVAKSELKVVLFAEILSAEFQFPFQLEKFRSILNGYEVEVSLQSGEKKDGILFKIGSNTTTLSIDSQKILIPNSSIQKIAYNRILQKRTDSSSEAIDHSVRLYEYLIPGSYQIRTGRNASGATLFIGTLFSAAAAEYEYLRGKSELKKQKEFNEEAILFGKEYGLLLVDFEYGAYYEHKNNNRSFLILTSFFYVLNLFDLWTWRPNSTTGESISFRILPSFRFPWNERSRSEAEAQIRLEFSF